MAETASVLTEVEWLAACLAPWALGPHPNFSGDVVDGPAMLAMCSDGRSGEAARYRARLVPSERPWESELVDTCTRSLFAETQRDAADTLSTLATNNELPLAARTASALYASVAYSELDEPERAVRILEEAAGSWAPPAGAGGSAVLCVAALHQQISLRAYEARLYSEAAGASAAVEELLHHVDERTFERFRVSRGISWGSRQVQRDIKAALLSNAIRMRSQLEDLRGDTWVRVVRGRPGWIGNRIDGKARRRDSAFVTEEFERRLDSTRGRRTIGASDVVLIEGAAADLGAELAGDLGRAQSARESLGCLRILRDGEQEWAATEGIRLLRHAESRNALESALRWIRRRGPNAALLSSATRILERPSFPSRITQGDLEVLRYAADILTTEQLAAAIEAVPNYLATPAPRGGPAGWKEREELWNTVARLVPESGLDDRVARDALEFVVSDPHFDIALVTPIYTLVAAIQWDQVAPEVVDGWLDWARAHVVDDDLDDLAYEVLLNLQREEALDLLVHRTGLNLPVTAVNEERLAARLDAATVARASEACVGALEAVRTEAANGALSFGGPDPADVGVAFALRFPDGLLWDRVADLLCDPKVDPSKKRRGLDRLAGAAQDVPARIVERLRLAWPDVTKVASVDDHFTNVVKLPYLPAGLRAAAALQIVPRRELLEPVSELAAHAAPSGRIEAARSVPFVVSGGGALEWGQVLLLQLSRDTDPVVMSEAGTALAVLSFAGGGLDDLVAARLLELLASEGSLAPLSVLHGFQRALRDGVESSGLPQEAVFGLATSHPLRVVRGAAREVLRLVAQGGPPPLGRAQ